MKRKALALILAVLMIVPAMAVVANAHNWAIASYLNDVTGGSGTDKWTVSAVNGGAADYGVAPNSAITSHDNPDAAGWLPDAITAADPQYWASGLIANIIDLQTVAPRMQIASNFKTALNKSNADIYTLTFANGNTFDFENWAPTMISYAFSTDPIPAVNTGATDDNYGYIVYDPDAEDAPDVGSASGLIQNGFVITFTSEGKVANVNSNLGKLVQATKVAAAIYEDGEIIAYSEAPITNNQTLNTKLEERASGSQPICSEVSFDGSTLDFTLGDGWGWGWNHYSFSVNDGNGWENLARLSPYQDYYAGILVGSPLEVSDLDGHENVNWGASSFALKSFNKPDDNHPVAPKDAVGTGDPYEDAVIDWLDDNKSALGLKATAGQVNETTKGMRLFFEVASNVVDGNVYLTKPAEEYIGVTHEAANASVSELGILFGKDTRTSATDWRQKLRIATDLVTPDSNISDHGNLAKKIIFKNGVQKGYIYSYEADKYTFTGMINNISEANLDSVYHMREYAIIAINGVPSARYYTASYAHHNYYNRAVGGGGWSTAKAF